MSPNSLMVVYVDPLGISLLLQGLESPVRLLSHGAEGPTSLGGHQPNKYPKGPCTQYLGTLEMGTSNFTTSFG